MKRLTGTLSRITGIHSLKSLSTTPEINALNAILKKYASAAIMDPNLEIPKAELEQAIATRKKRLLEENKQPGTNKTDIIYSLIEWLLLYPKEQSGFEQALVYPDGVPSSEEPKNISTTNSSPSASIGVKVTPSTSSTISTEDSAPAQSSTTPTTEAVAEKQEPTEAAVKNVPGLIRFYNLFFTPQKAAPIEIARITKAKESPSQSFSELFSPAPAKSKAMDPQKVGIISAVSELLDVDARFSQNMTNTVNALKKYEILFAPFIESYGMEKKIDITYKKVMQFYEKLVEKKEQIGAHVTRMQGTLKDFSTKLSQIHEIISTGWSLNDTLINIGSIIVYFNDIHEAFTGILNHSKPTLILNQQDKQIFENQLILPVQYLARMPLMFDDILKRYASYPEKDAKTVELIKATLDTFKNYGEIINDKVMKADGSLEDQIKTLIYEVEKLKQNHQAAFPENELLSTASSTISSPAPAVSSPGPH